MSKIKKFRTLEEEIALVQQKGAVNPLSIAEILQVLSGKGRSLVLILLSLPFCQPIQIPGLSTPFGLIIAFLGLRMTFGKKIWLPDRLLTKTIPDKVLSSITDKTLKLIRKIRRWIYPRFTWLCHSPIMEKMHGLAIFVLGIFLALPLPIPLSNLTAAWSILLVALGLLEDDGLFIFLGYLVSVLTLIFALVLISEAKDMLLIS